MFKIKKYRWIILTAALTLALLIGGASLLVNTSVANAAELTADNLQTLTQASTGPGLLGDGYLAHGGGGRWGFKGSGIDYKQLLADALGISVEKLEAAYEQARVAAIEQAVEKGLITREQADEMLVWGGLRSKEFGWFGLRRQGKGIRGDQIDENALLANALGITVEELQAAREKATEAAIAQAVEKGLITQEEADMMLARKNLQRYLNRDALLAKALGMTVEELQAAYAEGKTLTTLMNEKGLTAIQVRDALEEAYAQALAQAVADGVITQEQANELKEGQNLGFGGSMFPGGRMGPRGRGGMNGKPTCPQTDEGNTTSGMRFRHTERGARGGNNL